MTKLSSKDFEETICFRTIKIYLPRNQSKNEKKLFGARLLLVGNYPKRVIQFLKPRKISKTRRISRRLKHSQSYGPHHQHNYKKRSTSSGGLI